MKKAVFYFLLTILVISAIVWLYKYRGRFEHIVIPFFMAAIISYIVRPLSGKLMKKGFSPPAAILSVYGAFLVVAVAAAVFVFPELVNNTKELMDKLPQISEDWQKRLNSIVSVIRTSKWSEDIKGVIYNEITNATSFVQIYALGTLRNTMNYLVQLINLFVDFSLALFIAYYLIKDSNHFKEGFLSLSPRRWRNWLVNTGREINAVLENFIQGQLLTALIVSVMESIGLMLAGVKYALVLGVVGGLSNIIPYFGPYIGAVPAVAVALVQSPLKALWAIVVFAVVQQIDNSFISPKIIEGKLGLHPVTTVLAVLIGGAFFGILGMLLSVPLAAILKIIINKLVEAVV